MQTIQLRVHDGYVDEVFSVLKNLKNMVSDIKVFKDDLYDKIDIDLFEKSKKDMTGVKSIEELLKEYEIEVES